MAGNWRLFSYRSVSKGGRPLLLLLLLLLLRRLTPILGPSLLSAAGGGRSMERDWDGVFRELLKFWRYFPLPRARFWGISFFSVVSKKLASVFFTFIAISISANVNWQYWQMSIGNITCLCAFCDSTKIILNKRSWGVVMASLTLVLNFSVLNIFIVLNCIRI